MENLTGGTPPVRYLPCVVPCKLYFGTFETTERAARMGRNPQTGEDMEIPASKAPKFKVGKAFKDAVKNA